MMGAAGQAAASSFIALRSARCLYSFLRCGSDPKQLECVRKGCSAAPPYSVWRFRDMDAKQTVQQVTDEWRQAFNSGNAQGVAACYTEDGFFSSARTVPLSGRKAIEKHFAEVIQGAKITIRVQEANLITANVCVGVGDFSIKGPQGEMAGNCGLTMLGNKIALHVSNIPPSPSK